MDIFTAVALTFAFTGAGILAGHAIGYAKGQHAGRIEGLKLSTSIVEQTVRDIINKGEHHEDN